ncbi:hypothetical protein SAMN05660841_03397 [Sphingobacterium nematocida]|uniref:Uncharacterized protein n=1 Tax=Sphingobacterium nematocida TaxID=1513896 RepID=A0A1T5FN19_9SPHI|nr:hypothetical protein [Sphingobacterium nematocida]SKB97497.1 hypothetical protein SAMN05660841_03397 [Sphingobacterium nematocida]
MFWYTSKLYDIRRNATVVSILCLTAVVASSCNSASNSVHQSTGIEFDIPSFFRNEIELLNSTKPKVTKVVKKDSISETKQLIIADWQKELANFTSIDLNKAAYRGAYQKDSIGNTVTYSFTDSALDLSSVKIVYHNGVPSIFTINKVTKNLLYNTEENLEYIKGESYTIDKIQAVKTLGSHHYQIKGTIE